MESIKKDSAMAVLLSNNCSNPSELFTEANVSYVTLCCVAMKIHYSSLEDGSYTIHKTEVVEQ